MDDDPVGTLMLEGQVLEEEQGVSGAIVTISSNPSRTATTNEFGSFQFDKLVGRTYSIRAKAGNSIGGPVMHELTATSDPVAIRLRAGGVVIVTVVDQAKGDPVSGATVELRAGGDNQSETTDGDGKAKFEGVDGSGRRLKRGQLEVRSSR